MINKMPDISNCITALLKQAKKSNNTRRGYTYAFITIAFCLGLLC